ncbi:hypothetical protein FOQG_01896 [Fusarium oxysporum f. sp. raphani 54005]|uniref:Uncharacterized protein n=1 Tax=Fusarium oxysporum f. sp. raphani 54005 TaxID=1089458 RepID=X0D723_FUSOX|nr:hypothetical protein FOQG_01896 [Fusarium oxysporum f. sp. raphani 54005]
MRAAAGQCSSWTTHYRGSQLTMRLLNRSQMDRLGGLGKANVTAFHSSDLRDCGIGSEPTEVDRKFIGDYQPFEETSSQGNFGLVGMKTQ